MRCFALDPQTGDLSLADGRLSLVEGVDAVAQRLGGRLRLWRGEWFYDYDAGAWNLVEQQTGTLEKPLPITRA